MGANFGFKLNNSMVVGSSEDPSQLINDNIVSANKTWSSSKIDSTKQDKLLLSKKYALVTGYTYISVSNIVKPSSKFPIQTFRLTIPFGQLGSGEPSSTNIRAFRYCTQLSVMFIRGSTTYAVYPSFGETIYDAVIDLAKKTITKTKGYIASYQGETLSGEWASDRDVYVAGTSPTIGAAVLYDLSTPVVTSFDIEDLYFAQEDETYSINVYSNGNCYFNEAYIEYYSSQTSGLAFNKNDVKFTGSFSVNENATYSTGLNRIALGVDSQGRGENSIAIGNQTKAINKWSTAVGRQAMAQGESASAFGYGAIAQGKNSAAYGCSAVASGEESVACGILTNAGGKHSTAYGYRASASGEGSVAIGSGRYFTAPAAAKCWALVDHQIVLGGMPDTNDPNLSNYGLIFSTGDQQYPSIDMAIDWNGNMKLKGGLTVGSDIKSANTYVTKDTAIAPEYSDSATYSVDDYVTYKGLLYRCITAISTAETWDSTHWTETTVMAEIKRLINNN